MNDRQFTIRSLADPSYLDELRREARAKFPHALYGEPSDCCEEMLADFETAIADGSEELIQQSLAKHPYALQYAIDRSGHHGTWVFPKQMIKPSGADGLSGLIPDFLVASSSSLGYFWHVIELKRPDVQFAGVSGKGLSSAGNKGIAQCHGYLAHFDNYIDAVRSSIGLGELVRPEGAILIIGDSRTENEEQAKVRSNFSRNGSIRVVTYDRIRRGIVSDVGSRRTQA